MPRLYAVKTMAALPDSPTVSGVIVNANLSMLTLNLHGFNQLCDFLPDVCATGAVMMSSLLRNTG
jgi:hypothetical protein